MIDSTAKANHYNTIEYKNRSEYEYMFGSARTRALENGMIGRDRMARLCDARSAKELLSSLGEFGYVLATKEDTKTKSKDNNNKDIDREKTLTATLGKAYSDMDELAKGDGKGIVDYLRCQYDCNNIKSVIKCFIRNISVEGMLYEPPLCIIPNENGELYDLVKNAASKGEGGIPAKLPERYPKRMIAAIPEALSAYAKTNNPQTIDGIIDRACFSDMLEAAEKSGVPFAVECVRTRIDLINIISCERIKNITGEKNTAGKEMLDENMIEGGKLDKRFIFSLYDAGSDKTETYKKLSRTDYAKLADALIADGNENGFTIRALEKIADNFRMEKIKQAKKVPFGAEVLIGYLEGRENEIRNLRILLAGKDAGLSPDTIRERMRDCYV